MKPYFEEDGIVIYHGDCREVLPAISADSLITDPPYGETSLAWDVRASGWLSGVTASQLWCFGSMRFFLESTVEFSGWKFAQEIIWEKQNGSGFAVDRFNRVHEILTHWYRGSWADLHHETPRLKRTGPKKSVRTRGKTPHRGDIGTGAYSDDGFRLVRSVLQIRNEQARASHPTQKPVPLIELLIRYSVPLGGLVCDPFMGSGSTLIAAKNLGRRAVGMEINEHSCEIAANRLRQGVLELSA